MAWAVMLTLCGAGCGDSSSQQRPSASAVPSSSGTPATPSAAASAEASPDSKHVGSWSGPYDAKRGEVTVPDGVIYKAWEKDPGGFEGKGTLMFTISPDGTLSGSTSGALGPLVVTGMVEASGEVSGGVEPKDESDETGLRGVLTGTIAKEEGRVELTVSSADARIVRVAEITLRRAKP